MSLQNKFLHKTTTLLGTKAVALPVSEIYGTDSSLQHCVADSRYNCLMNEKMDFLNLGNTLFC